MKHLILTPILYRHIQLCLFLCVALWQIPTQAKEVQSPAQLQEEISTALASMPALAVPGHYSYYNRLAEDGWMPVAPSMPDPTWENKYIVFQKKHSYAIVVHRGRKTNRIDKRYGLLRFIYKYEDQPSVGYVLSNIPKDYHPISDGCPKVNEWEDSEKRCKASHGEDCMVKAFQEEMVVFAKLPTPCAQTSQLIHSAYRYSGNPQQGLIEVSAEGRECVVEDFRAKHCPVLTQ